jgi:hypothetical protein
VDSDESEISKPSVFPWTVNAAPSSTESSLPPLEDPDLVLYKECPFSSNSDYLPEDRYR